MHQLFIYSKKAYDSVTREVLCTTLVKFRIFMKLVRLIKMCLNETHNRVWLGRHLSDMCPIKNGLQQGAVLSLFFFICVLEYAIKRVPVKQDGFN